MPGPFSSPPPPPPPTSVTLSIGSCWVVAASFSILCTAFLLKTCMWSFTKVWNSALMLQHCSGACVCVFAIACYKMLSEEVWIGIENISLLFGIDSLRCVLNPPPPPPLLLHLSLRMGNTFYWDAALPELVVQLWLLLTTTLNINISMK